MPVMAPAALAIPLHRPAFEPEDLDALAEALKDGLLVGDGPRSQALAALARSTLGCVSAFPTTSGTHALELAFQSLQLQPGDEVVRPSPSSPFRMPSSLLARGRCLPKSIPTR